MGVVGAAGFTAGRAVTAAGRTNAGRVGAGGFVARAAGAGDAATGSLDGAGGFTKDGNGRLTGAMPPGAAEGRA